MEPKSDIIFIVNTFKNSVISLFKLCFTKVHVSGPEE